MLSAERRKLFQQIRQAQEYFHEERYTHAFNLVSHIEKNNLNIHLKIKLIQLKMNCLMLVGNIKAAQEYIEEQVSQNPLSSSINHEAARYYHKVSNYDRANRYYLRALCLAPERIDFALAYSQFLRERNAHSQALAVLYNSLQKNRHRSNSLGGSLLLLEIGQIYYYRKQYWRAAILLTYSAKNQTEFPYYDLIADCYLNRGNYLQSIVFIQKHLQSWGENDADALYIYAKALAGIGRKADALALLKRCQKLMGELVITAGDLTHLYSLVQDGSLKKMPNVTLTLY